MVIMGIDPGYATVGYGVVSVRSGKRRPTEYGVITTQAGEVSEDRLVLIYDLMCMVLAHNRPDAVSIEKLYFTNSKATVTGAAEARGAILLAVRKVEVSIFEYVPLQVRQAVTGYGQAKKPQVMEMTRKFLYLTELPKSDDTAGTLAIAICHGQAVGPPLHRTMLPGGIR